jgi:hypothetical protein
MAGAYGQRSLGVRSGHDRENAVGLSRAGFERRIGLFHVKRRAPSMERVSRETSRWEDAADNGRVRPLTYLPGKEESAVQ